jgi:hypothetical protein
MSSKLFLRIGWLGSLLTGLGICVMLFGVAFVDTLVVWPWPLDLLLDPVFLATVMADRVITAGVSVFCVGLLTLLLAVFTK